MDHRCRWWIPVSSLIFTHFQWRKTFSHSLSSHSLSLGVCVYRTRNILLFGFRSDYARGLSASEWFGWQRQKLDMRITKLHPNEWNTFWLCWTEKPVDCIQLCVVNTIGIYSREIYGQNGPRDECAWDRLPASKLHRLKFRVWNGSVCDKCNWSYYFSLCSYLL